MPPNKSTDSEILTEDLIIDSLGYLKVPRKFKDLYPKWKESSPVATTKETADGKVHLTYIFIKEDIKN